MIKTEKEINDEKLAKKLAKIDAKIDQVEQTRIKQGYKYRNDIWVHSKRGDDKVERIYSKEKPTLEGLQKAFKSGKITKVVSTKI